MGGGCAHAASPRLSTALHCKMLRWLMLCLPRFPLLASFTAFPAETRLWRGPKNAFCALTALLCAGNLVASGQAVSLELDVGKSDGPISTTRRPIWARGSRPTPSVDHPTPRASSSRKCEPFVLLLKVPRARLTRCLVQWHGGQAAQLRYPEVRPGAAH